MISNDADGADCTAGSASPFRVATLRANARACKTDRLRARHDAVRIARHDPKRSALRTGLDHGQHRELLVRANHVERQGGFRYASRPVPRRA